MLYGRRLQKTDPHSRILHPRVAARARRSCSDGNFLSEDDEHRFLRIWTLRVPRAITMKDIISPKPHGKKIAGHSQWTASNRSLARGIVFALIPHNIVSRIRKPTQKECCSKTLRHCMPRVHSSRDEAYTSSNREFIPVSVFAIRPSRGVYSGSIRRSHPWTRSRLIAKHRRARQLRQTLAGLFSVQISMLIVSLGTPSRQCNLSPLLINRAR